MPILGYAEAFAKHGAKLKNVQWSVCAQADDGCLVVSLWEHHFKPPRDGRIICTDRFDRWKGPGNSEFRERVAAAFEKNQPVRVVVSHTEDPTEVQSGVDAGTLKNTFSIPDSWIGRVSKIDGEQYEFEFRRSGPRDARKIGMMQISGTRKH
jgi:hypothetical protein